MSGLKNLEDAIAKMEVAAEACREATREANAAKKDLDRSIKEAREFLKTEVETTVAATVHDALEEFGKQLSEWSDKLYDHVGGQLDILINLSIGKPGSKGDLRPTMAAMFRHWIGEQLALSRVPALVVLGDVPGEVLARGGQLESDMVIPHGVNITASDVNDAIRKAAGD